MHVISCHKLINSNWLRQVVVDIIIFNEWSLIKQYFLSIYSIIFNVEYLLLLIYTKMWYHYNRVSVIYTIILLYSDIKLSLPKIHENNDKLSLIKLNFIIRQVIFRSKYGWQVITYKILEITQMLGISCQKWN